jgi:hypothetical protein
MQNQAMSDRFITENSIDIDIDTKVAILHMDLSDNILGSYASLSVTKTKIGCHLLWERLPFS